MSRIQDAYFFNLFSQSAECAGKAIQLLEDIVRDFNASRMTEYTEQMHEIEHTADSKKHELMSLLVKTFITPIDREDIVQVGQTLDELTDKIEDVLIKMYCNRVSAMRPDMVEMVQIVHQCCDEVIAMLREFSNFKRSKTLKEHIIRINTLEEQTDRLYIVCMHRLHDPQTPVLEIMAWRDVYTYLEKCADAAEHIADVVESVAMKNS